MKYHFTISGNDDDGWTLNVYKRISKDVITTHWGIPKVYDSIEELANEMDALRNES